MVRPLAEVFHDLAALGTAADRIWPDPTMPFQRTPGPLLVGVTRERHGPIHAVLDAYVVNQCIAWRAELGFLRGVHRFEVQDVGQGVTLVRHVLRITLAWWFVPVWRWSVRRAHDRILEGLLDRLAAGAASRGAGA
jgi:hypothetical protein